MHFVRRAASRAASASPSILSQSRSINTSSFALRSKQQSALAQSIFKRFYSEEKSNQGTGTVGEAVNAAKEYATEAAESVKETVGGVAAAAREYAPRGFGGDRGGDRGGRGGYSNDRQGGFRNREDRGERAPQRFNRDREGAAPRIVKPTQSIYVGNLLFDVTAADLEREFAQFGTISKALIATDDRGLSKGFGYVHFENVQQAAAAIESKHQSVFEGRRIVVNYQLENNRSVSAGEPSKTLFIGNIPFEMSDADLNKLFRDIKNVIDVRVAIDRRSGQPRGFAHADFVDIESASLGKDALANKELYGRKLRVDFSAGARERAPRQDRAERSEQGQDSTF